MLWTAFAVVHLGVAVLGWVMPNQPMGDVYFVYEKWARQAVFGGGLVGITEQWVYPQLALVPMVIAQGLSWIGGYIVAWAIMVTAFDAVAFGLLIGRGRSAGRTVGAWFWLAFIAALGPVGMYRIDAVTVPLALAGSLWLVGRPQVASALLAAATWIKVWPAALIAAALIAVRRRWALLIGAAAVSAVVVAVVIAAGGAPWLFGFVTAQTGRGLQIEAPVSSPFLIGAALRLPGFWVFYDPTMLTFQVTGTNVDPVIAWMTPLLAAGILSICALGAVKAWRGASFVRLYPPLALALVTAFISLNKVGSPQYLVWLVAPLTVWLVIDRARAWAPAVAGLALAGLTQLIYPVLYDQLMRTYPELSVVLLLALRNAGFVALCVWAVVRVARVPAAHALRAASGTVAALARTPDPAHRPG